MGESQLYEWVESSLGSVPSNAVVAGYDSGEPIYIGRVTHEGNLLPGKIHPSHECCYVAWDGREHPYSQYEVLCSNSEDEPNWKQVSGDEIPDDAVEGGNTEDGEILYVGRQMHEGNMVPGRVQKSQSCLFLSYGCQEHSYGEYEVLVSGSS